jgi:hypothetical protein
MSFIEQLSIRRKFALSMKQCPVALRRILPPSPVRHTTSLALPGI